MASTPTPPAAPIRATARVTWALAFAAALAATARPAHAAPAMAGDGFIVDDVEVCPASADVVDPEFHPDGDRVVFMDSTGRVRVAGILPDGSIDSPACEGETVDTGSVWTLPDITFRQGPEWGLSARGSEIIHTRQLKDGSFTLARAWRDGGVWRAENLLRGSERGMQIVSRDVQDPQSRIMYLRRMSDGSYRPHWRESNKPLTEAALNASGSLDSGGVPRWVPDRRWISFAQADADGVAQATVRDLDTGVSRQLTTGPGRKDEVWLWQAPEFGGDWAMLTVVDSAVLRIYREIDGVFTPMLEYDVRALAGLNKIYSPEPVVYQDRSYIAFQASNIKLDPKSQMWFVSADPAAPMARRVTDPAVRAVRIEPEWLVTPSGLYLYYTQYSGKLSALRRAATGL